MERPLTITGCAGVIALLALTVAAEVRYDAGGSSAYHARAATGVATLRLGESASSEPLIAVDEAGILARPLFLPNRRPPLVKGTEIAATPSDDLPRLTGIVIDDPTRLAIFQPRKPDKPIIVGVGEFVRGWRVTAIDAREIVIVGLLGEERLQPTPEISQTALLATAPTPPPILIQPTAPQHVGEPRPRAGVFREETGFRVLQK